MYPFPRGLRLHARTLADVELRAGRAVVDLAPADQDGAGQPRGRVAAAGTDQPGGRCCWRARTPPCARPGSNCAWPATNWPSASASRTGEWQEELAARHAAEADFALLTAERTRLARELHDTLEQTIASVALQLDAAKGFFHEQPDESQRLLDAATQQLRESQFEVRRSVWNLALGEAGGSHACPRPCSNWARRWRTPMGRRSKCVARANRVHVPPGVASHLFRIAQEGVTNALKHAQARKIEIILDFKPDGVELCVNDDGCGFDPSAPSLNGHFGLRGLKERARALDAELALDSKSGQGTRLRLTVPAAGLRGDLNDDRF